MMNAAPQPVSASTSNGSGVAPVIRRTSSHTSFRLVMSQIGQPERGVRDAGAGEVERLEARALRQQGAVRIDRADHLQGALGLERRPQARTR